MVLNNEHIVSARLDSMPKIKHTLDFASSKLVSDAETEHECSSFGESGGDMCMPRGSHNA